MTTLAPTPAYDVIKRKQQKAWASGDYGNLAARLPIISERLADVAELRAGSRVLDVAGGHGNTALAAARSGAHVTSLDFVPELLAQAAERSHAERLPIEFVVGDAEELPFPDASFDAVISAIGVQFAPNQARAAAELLRVCRPGGTIALASWTPDGFVGDVFRTMAEHVPPPAGLRSPMYWGTKHGVGDLLDTAVSSIGAAHRHYTFRFPSAEAFVDFFRINYGPTLKAFEALPEDGRAVLAEELATVARRHNKLGADDDAVAMPAEYLEVVAVRAV